MGDHDSGPDLRPAAAVEATAPTVDADGTPIKVGDVVTLRGKIYALISGGFVRLVEERGGKPFYPLAFDAHASAVRVVPPASPAALVFDDRELGEAIAKVQEEAKVKMEAIEAKRRK